MNGIRSFLIAAIVLLALATVGCKTLDTSTPSGWQSGGGWQNFRAEASAVVTA
jgi:hypothetical protein